MGLGGRNEFQHAEHCSGASCTAMFPCADVQVVRANMQTFVMALAGLIVLASLFV